MTFEIVESWVDLAIRAKVKMIISIAGSARDAIIISRLEPMPPKLVPTSMPASARKKRALPSRAAMAMRSAVPLKSRPVAKVGTRAAATHVAAKIRYGATRNSQDALSASTTSFCSSRRRSRYG